MKSCNDAADIVAGEITKAHGIQGDIFVKILTSDAQWIEGLSEIEIHAPKGDGKKNLRLSSLGFHKAGVILRSPQIKTRNEAETLIGWKIRLPKDFFRSVVGERIYLNEVKGFEVFAASTTMTDRRQLLAYLGVGLDYDPFLMPDLAGKSTTQYTFKALSEARYGKSDDSEVSDEVADAGETGSDPEKPVTILNSSEAVSKFASENLSWDLIGQVIDFSSNGPQDILVVKKPLKVSIQGGAKARKSEKVKEKVKAIASEKAKIKNRSEVNVKTEFQLVEIPFVAEFVIHIDYGDKQIRMNLPEGLI